MKQPSTYAVALVLIFISCSWVLKAQIEFPEAIGDTIVLDTIPLLEAPVKKQQVLSDEYIASKLKSLQRDIPLRYNSTVKAFIQVFVNNRKDYITGVAQRSHYYFPLFEQYLNKYQLPQQLKYLPVIESALHAKARSWASAVGLWQFIPSTGKFFNLHQDAYVDERMEPNMSTQAACIYLKQLYNMFGDWELALASYNCGPGFVKRAIRYAGGKMDFWKIYPYLPPETRSYVPMFVAVIYLLNSMDEHGISRDSSLFLPLSDTIHVSKPLHLHALARELELNTLELEMLNPHLKQAIVPAYLKNCVLNLPRTAVAQLNVDRNCILDSTLVHSRRAFMPTRTKPVLSKTGSVPTYQTASMFPSFSITGKTRVLHTVQNGDILGHIADLYKVSVAALKSWNSLRSNMIWAGQKLSIWIDKDKAAQETLSQTRLVSSKSAEVKPKSEANPSELKSIQVGEKNKKDNKGVLTHRVAVGETLWRIAQRHHTSIENLRILNQLKDNKINVGQVLILK
jgi:membrane-bound lytic murein transglycosylase D